MARCTVEGYVQMEATVTYGKSFNDQVLETTWTTWVVLFNSYCLDVVSRIFKDEVKKTGSNYVWCSYL
jgi:hypothetical protein